MHLYYFFKYILLFLYKEIAICSLMIIIEPIAIDNLVICRGQRLNSLKIQDSEEAVTVLLSFYNEIFLCTFSTYF